MANFNDRKDGAPPREIHVEGKNSPNWLAWIALALGLLALVYWLSKGRENVVAPVENSAVAVKARCCGALS